MMICPSCSQPLGWRFGRCPACAFTEHCEPHMAEEVRGARDFTLLRTVADGGEWPCLNEEISGI